MYNSDGYVMIDMKDVNMSLSSQHITGIYNRVVSVIDTNKLALIVNAGSNTPMAAVVHKRLNYYVINTTLYIFTINSNDIVIIEEAGTATVDVEIVPTLTEGVKVADFAIGSVEGSIYAPAQQSEINDNVTASNTTWSSDKISNELSAKADSSSLATVATTGAYSDLSGTPTIPVLTDLIDDTSMAVNKVWSSDKTAAEIAAGAGVTIDDTTTSTTKTWSSDKINSELSDKADTSTTYTKTEVDTALSLKQNSTDNSLTTFDKTIVGAINEVNSNSEYHVGDTLNISNLQLTGLITSGQKSIYIQIPLTKPIGNDVNTITLNANALFFIRHVAGGYIISNQTLTSIGTVTLKKNISGIFIGVDMTNAFTGCPNNTPLVISTGEGLNDYITFS